MSNLYDTAPAKSVASVTPSDSTILSDVRALYIGGAGNLVVECWDGSSATLASVPAGTVLPIKAKRVKVATTATSIVALG